MERQEGYYWVKYNDSFKVFEWTCDRFWMCGDEEEVFEKNIDFINENRIKAPGELPE